MILAACRDIRPGRKAADDLLSVPTPWVGHPILCSLCGESRQTREEARPLPLAQAAARLIPQPAPGHLDGDRPDVPTPRLTDPLFPALVATLVRRRCEPRRRPNLLAVPEPSPPEELVHIDPRAGRPDRAQAEQLPDFVNSLAVPVGNRALTFAFQLENPRAQELRVLPFPLQPGPQRRGHGRADPQAPRRRRGPDVGAGRQPEALVREQAVHPVRHPNAFPASR